MTDVTSEVEERQANAVAGGEVDVRRAVVVRGDSCAEPAVGRGIVLDRERVEAFAPVGAVEVEQGTANLAGSDRQLDGVLDEQRARHWRAW